MPTPAGLVQQHLSPKTNTPGTDRRKFIQVHFPSPLSLCKCDGKQLHPWGLAFCWPCSMSMDGPFLSLLSDPLLSEMEPCVCETLSGCPFHRPSLPTPILTAPGRGLELCFLIVFPKNITTATYWVNPPPSVQGVRREGNVGLISPGIFWVLCPSHETGRFEAPLPSLVPHGVMAVLSVLPVPPALHTFPVCWARTTVHKARRGICPLCHLPLLVSPQPPHLPSTVKKSFACF